MAVLAQCHAYAQGVVSDVGRHGRSSHMGEDFGRSRVLE